MARPLPGLSAAWRALGWLDAVTVQVRYFRAGRRSRLYSLGGEVRDLDAIASADATDSARLVFGAGVTARPLPGLSIGLSAGPAAPVHAQASSRRAARSPIRR